MMYLARLKGLLAENRAPDEPPKLTKGASVSFVSGRGRCVFGNDDAKTSDLDVIERNHLPEKRTPEEPTQLTKAPSVGFVGDHGRRSSLDEAAIAARASVLSCPDEPDAAAIEERAGLAADSVLPVYLDAWARLNCQKPFDASEADWHRALDDGGRFLETWGEDAAALGWKPGELFDVRAGLIWRLAGERVTALGPDHARLGDGRTLERKRGGR
jgi:hypothetical protein